MKRIYVMLAALTALVCIAGAMIVTVFLDARPGLREPAHTADVVPAPANTLKPAAAIMSDTPTDTAVERAYTAAAQYLDIYDTVYAGGGLILSEDEEREIILRLGSLGYTTAMQFGGIEMENSAALNEFLSSAETGSDAEIAIYELCPDAGFLCHTLHRSGDVCYVTRTRLAWISDDGTRFQGSTPCVTYSETYSVTELYVESGWLYYDYYIPDNPPGTKHDGHIETLTSLYIGSSD